MQLLSRMNKKMDQGYKITNFSCTHCSGVTLAKPNAQNKQGYIYCPKCDKQYIPDSHQLPDNDQEQLYNQIIQQSYKNAEETVKKNIMQLKIQQPEKFKQEHEQQRQLQDQIQVQYNQFLSLYNSTVKTPQQLKSQQTSRKIGQKLINGWAMLEQACEQCNVPLMKSKKGELICCSCDKDYSKVVKKKQQQKNRKNTQKNKQQQKDQKFQYKNPNISTKQNIKQHQYAKLTQKLQNISTQQHAKKVYIQKQKPQYQHSHYLPNKSQQAYQKINKICNKTLQFLQTKLDQAFSLNDLQAVEKILRTIKNTKQLL